MSVIASFLLSAVAAPLAPSAPRPTRDAGATVESSQGKDTPTITLAEALSILDRESPGTAATRARIGDAKSDVIAARILPNPSLDYAGTRLRSGTNTGAAQVDEWGIEWPLLLFGQRKRRTVAAEAGVSAEAARIDVDLAAKARDVRVAFTDLLSQQERQRILEEARSDLERVAQIVSGRKGAGEASEYDSLRVETEFRSMDAQLGDARGDVADARGRLAVLLGRPGDAPRAAGPLELDPPIAGNVEALWAETSSRLPEIQAARRSEEAAQAAVTAASRDAWPVPVLSGGASLTKDAQSTSATFGVTIPLAVLDRNQGAIAKARAHAEEAALERKAVEVETRADLERAVGVAAERRAALSEIDAKVSARLPEMKTMAESAYREGRGDILDLLDALRSLTSTRLARVDAFGSAAHADADLIYLTGHATEVPADRTAPQ